MTGPFSLRGRVAVVTGGSSGIGAGMATALARAGARVVLVARDPARLAAAAGETNAVGWVSFDLSERSEIAGAASAVSARFGDPDILVNCAGINLRPPLGELSEADWDLTVAKTHH